MNNFEVKRISGITYIFHQKKNLLGEIKGPYQPGGVWWAALFKTKPEFEQAWKENKLTAIQRGKITHTQDRMIAAMTWSDSHSVDPELYIETEVLGYQYKTKKQAKEAAERVLSVELWV